MALLLNENDIVSRSYSITKPSPLHPIYPSECGERTENLCDENNINQGYYAYADGQYSYIGTWVNTYYIAIKGNTEYTAKFKTIYNRSRWYGFVWYDSDKQYISTTNTQANPSGCELTATSPANASFCVFNMCTHNTIDNLSPSDVIYCMLNAGSIALPYEPYGYKLPLTVNGVEYPIYLGEAETTRRIKKLMFDGTENWRTDSGRFTIILNDIKTQGLRLTEFYCSSYQVISDGRAYADVPNNAIYTGAESAGSSSSVYIYIHADEYTDTTSFKSYLAAQYAAGTPVTIWYVLAEPETSIVNEPLMKIGNYADTIDSTQSSVQLPTSAGSTTISWAGEGLAPSQFDSIQEWVDTPTYKCVNGEWVEE